ncbi:MAG: hypothetical protein ABIK99_05555 [candidate division WOR-3 bacterium]
MMEISRLTEKIIKEAEEEKERVKQEYAAKISELKAEIEKEKEALRQKESQKLRREIEKRKKKILAEEKTKSRNELLSYQWQMIQEIIKEVKRRIRLGDYLAILRQVIKEWAAPNDTITLAVEDFPFLAKEFPELKKENSKELSAGVIIKKEKEEIDFSLESIWEKIKGEVILFLGRYLL